MLLYLTASTIKSDWERNNRFAIYFNDFNFFKGIILSSLINSFSDNNL